jgi:hypothetical protein
MRPSDEDSLERRDSDAPGWHVREKTEEGYPLMGSSPAERQEAVDRAFRIKREAMREHHFVGDGPYCEGRIPFAPVGSAETGWITGWAGCGYPRDMHHVPEREPDGLCADRSEHPAHLHESSSLGIFWCTADQAAREPWRSERRRAAHLPQGSPAAA